MDRTRRRQTTPDESTRTEIKTGVAVIGLGAVGSSLAMSLYLARYRITAIITRSPERTRDVAAQLEVGVLSNHPADVPEETALIFICTREESFEAVIAALSTRSRDWRRTVVAHTSGRATSDVLSPLRDLGAAVLSFHPLGSFPPDMPPKTFDRLTVGLEGDPEAVEVGRVLAGDLGANPVEIPKDAKEDYHLAAVVTSNHLIALMADVEKILSSAGLPPDLTLSLARDTLNNLASRSAVDSLTGPVSRGDVEALSAQVARIRSLDPELLRRYCVLAEATVQLAVAGGRISDAVAQKLRRVLAEARLTEGT